MYYITIKYGLSSEYLMVCIWHLNIHKENNAFSGTTPVELADLEELQILNLGKL